MFRALKRLIVGHDDSLPRIQLSEAWDIEPGDEPGRFIEALAELRPAASLLVLEGSSMAPAVRDSLRVHEVSTEVVVRRGTIWPRSALVHLDPSPATLSTLLTLFANHAAPEICDHLYIVGRGEIIAEWHDAFMGNPLLISGTVPEALVSRFAEKLGVAPRRVRSKASAERTFLSAEWRNLVMLNYEVEPSVLAGRVPAGCELDAWGGRYFVSVVGFQFLRTRVLGLAIPFHRDFEEVNLRFYVRHEDQGDWRRGVVFVRELVPRRAIALVANHVYGESYGVLPMRHAVELSGGGGSNRVSYEWRQHDRWEGISATFSGDPILPAGDAEETFITEHYWGYAQRPGRSAVEYRVEHPRWHVWHADTASLECDVSSLYGPEFRDVLSGSPSSAFVADGSAVVVRRRRHLE